MSYLLCLWGFALNLSFLPFKGWSSRSNDYFSTHGLYLPYIPVMSPHSLKLMSCKNSINMPPQCSFSPFSPNILFILYFYSPHIQPTLSCLTFLYYLPHFSYFLIALFASFISDTVLMLLHTHCLGFMQVLHLHLNTWVNLIRCCWVRHSVTHPIKWGHCEKSPFILDLLWN